MLAGLADRCSPVNDSFVPGSGIRARESPDICCAQHLASLDLMKGLSIDSRAAS